MLIFRFSIFLLLHISNLISFNSASLTTFILKNKIITKLPYIKKFFKSRICYSSNNSSSFNPTLLVSGDIELNPGPTVKPKCTICIECNIRIYKNISFSCCPTCNNKFHVKCQPTSSSCCSICNINVNLPFLDNSLNSSLTSQPSTSSFYDTCNPLLKQQNVNNLKILHFNIRSLYKNIDSLKEYLTAFNYSPDIILLSETWIQNKFNNKLSSISNLCFAPKPMTLFLGEISILTF